MRRCPACGRRFVVRLQSKKLVNTEESTERIALGLASTTIPIERETFEVTFECHHCHHKWTETVVKAEKEK
jgi:predicted RNA-binding Zn-ribbon protein involved in translation (DUF1610 family)